MAKDTITIKVSQNFHSWWLKQPYYKDKGLMFVAWAAWNACEIRKRSDNAIKPRTKINN